MRNRVLWGTFFLILPPKMNKWNENHFRIQWHYKMICICIDWTMENGKGWGRMTNKRGRNLLNHRIESKFEWHSCASSTRTICVWAKLKVFRIQWLWCVHLVPNFLWRIEATRRRTSNARKMLKFWCVRIHCADIFFVLLIWPNYRDEKTLYPWHCSTHFFSLCSSLLLLL